MKKLTYTLFLLLCFTVNGVAQLLFSWDGRTGGFKDEVSKTFGTPTAVTFAKDRKGLTGYFDATLNPHIQFSSIDAVNVGTGNISFCFWVKPRDNGGFRTIIAKQTFTELQIRIQTDNKLALFSDVASVTSTSALTMDVWNFIILTRSSGGTLNFYINSNAIDKTGSSAFNLDNAFDLYIGNRSGLAHDFDGCIAKVSIYNKVLTQSEINDLYFEFYNSQATIEENYPKNLSKPVDLSYENGLVAAYNMVSQSGVVTDISGNGNYGTIEGAISMAKGMNFGLDNQHVKIENNTLLNGATAVTLMARVKANSLTANDGLLTSRGTYLNGMIIISSNRLQFRINNTTLTSDIDDLSTVDYMNIACVWDGATENGKIYLNGVNIKDDDIAQTSLTVDDFWKIGQDEAIASRVFDGDIEQVKIYNRALTEQEIIDWHSSYATNKVFSEHFKDDGVGDNLPTHWIKGTGTYEIAELTADDAVISELKAGTKFMRCTSAGTIAIPVTKAYGKYRFYIYKGGDANYAQINFTADMIDVYPNVTSYGIRFRDDEEVQLYLYEPDNLTNLFRTVDNYISNSIWYGIDIERTLSGEFTTDIKGGAFGNTWTLIDVSGGSGTNPVTDNTYTTSQYIVLDLDLNDCIALIDIYESIEQ